MENRQARMMAWVRDLGMGDDKRTRALRFLEEAVEAVQAAELSLEDQLHVVRVVNAREVGHLPQEIGGVMVTLYTFADVHGISVDEEADRELERIHTPEVMEKCRRHQAEKKAMGL